MKKGRFLTLEGGEGVGKTTQRAKLVRALETLFHLDGQPLKVLSTREPGGSSGAESIRDMLVSGVVERWDTRTEALLHVAARRDHLLRTILPALEAGTWVVCDRFSDSTTAYQGFGHGVDLDALAQLHTFACDGFQPDLTLILDMPVWRGLARAKDRERALQQAREAVKKAGRALPVENRYEAMGEDFHERVRAGFLSLAAQNPNRCRVIDADVDENTLHAAMMVQVREKFPELDEVTPTP